MQGLAAYSNNSMKACLRDGGISGPWPDIGTFWTYKYISARRQTLRTPVPLSNLRAFNNASVDVMTLNHAASNCILGFLCAILYQFLSFVNFNIYYSRLYW